MPFDCQSTRSQQIREASIQFQLRHWPGTTEGKSLVKVFFPSPFNPLEFLLCTAQQLALVSLKCMNLIRGSTAGNTNRNTDSLLYCDRKNFALHLAAIIS